MNYVTSCHQVESAVLPCPVSTAWEALKGFNFDKVLSTHVKGVKFTSGSPSEVGSLFEVHYADGSCWHYRIVEISESRRVLSYELISAEPEISFSSMLTVIRLYKVTEDNTTFVSWETDYSNDVNAHVVQDGKFKKLDYFKDLKNLCKK
jgi:hypothetical protein